MTTEDASKPKGHWPKGKSRNLDPSRIAQARTLLDLLNRAINACWKHPTLNVLTVSGVADYLKVDRTTVHRWLSGSRLPPLWSLDELRTLLRDFKP